MDMLRSLQRTKSGTPENGFTIVELLIVIVVIAILAAISIVSYTGIQQQARNQARISAATQIAKALDLYVVDTGRVIPGPPVCIPLLNGKDVNGDTFSGCNRVDGGGTMWSEKVATSNVLRAAGFPSVSFPDQVVRGSNGVEYAGVSYTYSSSNMGMNGMLQPYFIQFQLEGVDKDCGSSKSISLDPSKTSADPLNAVISARNSGTYGDSTMCRYTIRHPSSI